MQKLLQIKLFGDSRIGLAHHILVLLFLSCSFETVFDLYVPPALVGDSFRDCEVMLHFLVHVLTIYAFAILKTLLLVFMIS